MRALLVGVGAAGNKAVMTTVEKGIIPIEDTMIVNSTSKDFPKNYTGSNKVILSPKNTGCGKERAIARDYALTALQSGKFNIDTNSYNTVIICTSVEGGTGSGSAPIIANFFNQVFRKNVHIIAFTGFEEDVRGLGNTVEFFQDISDNLVIQVIRNKAFLKEAGGNKFLAEQLANEEMANRIKILIGKEFIESDQNIDDTDILKLSNTAGFMTVEEAYINEPLVDVSDFNRLTKKMIYDTKSVLPEDPGAARIGVILNIKPATEPAIDNSFTDIKKYFGCSYECFLQKQWDGKEEYIAIIVSGMKMPIEEIRAVYARYKEENSKVNKTSDTFFTEMKSMTLETSDSKFDMIKPVQNNGIAMEEFMKQFQTK